jgi:hypothetical protein
MGKSPDRLGVKILSRAGLKLDLLLCQLLERNIDVMV